jgi:hypothetical protein
MFVDPGVVAGFISAIASLITIGVLVNVNWFFGIKGMLSVIAVLGIVYYFVAMRRVDS